MLTFGFILFYLFLAATHPSGVLGPNPVYEGSILPLSTRDPLFLPGTDDKGDAGPQNDDEVEGTEGEDGNGGVENEVLYTS